MIVLSPTQSDLLKALGNFIVSILPGWQPVTGQSNRTPPPKANNYVVMTPILRERLATNTDSSGDVSFTASIAGTTMNVSHVDFGQLAVGQQVFGVDLADDTTITAFGSGSGGAGTYTVSPGQTVAPELMASGSDAVLQPTQVTVQLDFHSATLEPAADAAQTFTTLFRDQYGVEAFEGLTPNLVPLFAQDPRQVPFINDQDQYETRWVVDAVLQVNQTVSNIPQQFADALDVDLISVDADYPV